MTVLVMCNSKVYVESKQTCIQRFSHATITALWLDPAFNCETHTEVQRMTMMLRSVTMQ